ncbi:hypothetical protein P3T40_007060 [Paraburkholderia sp. EB58]|jgi:hypothetical protein
MSFSATPQGRGSVLDDPAILARLRHAYDQRSKDPKSLKHSYPSLARDILRHHGVRVVASTIRRQMERLGLDEPWRRSPRKKK